MNYKDLLCTPMLEVAQIDGNFQQAYQTQKSIIEGWFNQQPKLLNDPQGELTNYAEEIILLRQKKHAA